MTVSKEEFHMFRAGKKRGMEKMLGVLFFSMLFAAVICGLFCSSVETTISVFSTLVLTVCFGYAFMDGQNCDDE